MRNLYNLLLVVLFSLGGALYGQTTDTYTSNGTFEVPPGVTEITVECWGGGGRGGERTGSSGTGGGGGGGAYARSVLSVTPGDTYSVTIGAGSSNTSPGGDSWFGSAATVMAKGGNSAANNSTAGASGGAAASSVGDVRYSGGNGATATGNSGGGGSSAGTGANGANGTVTGGGSAPAGGGNGGNGVSAGSGNGSSGIAPGGGGGGGKRGCVWIFCAGGGAGSGANGQVRVTYTFQFPANTCVNAAPYSAIPDNGCGSNNGINVPITISGLPTLGSGPGNAVLQRVEVIANHTYNADITIRLTSPTAQTRDILLNRFGSGDDLGFPGTCPAQPLVFEDGGSPLVNANTNNPTGPYAPEQTLAGFTGDPNGTWTLFVCDNAGLDIGNLRYVNLVFGTYDCQSVLNGPDQPGSPCDDGDPFTAQDTWSAGCVCESVPNILYSVASGTFGNTSTWSYSPGGPVAGVIPDAFSSVVITNGHTVTVNSARNVRDLTIEAGATLDLDVGSLQVNGSTVTLDGTVVPGTGTLILGGAQAITVGGTAAATFHNLTLDNTAGATVNSNVDIVNNLQLNNGTFTAVGAIRLLSTASRTARMGAVGSGAAYSGNITMQRYIPGGATNWRLLGSPVGGRTVADWNDDFYTAGFPGSNWPNFIVNGQPWASVQWYDETDTGANLNDGLTGVTGTSHSLAVGQGFAVWSGDALGGTNPFTVDVTGPPTIASSPISLPLSWTDTGDPAIDGWNLVSNPLPSGITFTGITRGANVQNAYWIYNPATGNHATWSNGVGTNGATGAIQSSQAFWMRTNGVDVSATVAESAKTGNQGGGFFGGQEQLAIPMVRLAIAGGALGFSDETVVAFHDGTPALDDMDAAKIDFFHAQAPRIGTLSSEGELLAISMYGDFSNAISIPVKVAVGQNGSYTITASDMAHLEGLSCLVLEDLQTGNITPLTEGATYTFIMNTSANSGAPRFMLHASTPIAVSTQPATCAGSADGVATIVLPEGPADVIWSDADGNVLQTLPAQPAGEVVLDGLPAGTYAVSIGTSTVCGTLVNTITIEEPFALEAEATIDHAACAGDATGSIALEVLGGQAPYSYAWSTGATSAAIEDLAAGIYGVTVADANGCTIALMELFVNEEAPIEGEILAPEAVAALETITFTSTAADDLAHHWDFGDGSTSTMAQPIHSYALPGDYMVVLTLQDGDCSRSLERPISVYVSTGVEDTQLDGLRAWSTGHSIVLLNNGLTEGELTVRDAAGRLVTRALLVNGAERMELSTAGWSMGIYHLEVLGDHGRWSTSLPVGH